MTARSTLLDPAVLRFALSRPPLTVARWATRRALSRLRDSMRPWRPGWLETDALLAALGGGDIDALWDDLTARPFPGITQIAGATVGSSEAARIRRAADDVCARRISLLGSGAVSLGAPIDWHRDFVTGYRWPEAPSPTIDYAALGEACDVKRPWELSRLQWLIPAGQAWLLDHDPRMPAALRDIVAEWIDANPPGIGINWTVPMEAALRAIALIWLCRALRDAPGWTDPAWRARVLAALYTHGDFIERHLEIADVNGNHLTADAAGLVTIGLFLGDGETARRWQAEGWRLLLKELPRQVHPDGVDFEAASGYHRLALELFLLPALCRRAGGLDVPQSYWTRLGRMADVIAAYTGPDGNAPLWGDADDGRVLPFGPQNPNDHRGTANLAAAALGAPAYFDEPETAAETKWWLGGRPDAAPRGPILSAGFPDGGVYVMRAEGSHVFIDCGPIGLAGRGGHGHNDCLSFEAALDGVRLVSDSGTFTYTGSVVQRNRYRATAAHNTPRIDGEEMNRQVRPDLLWIARDDAVPEATAWLSNAARDIFIGTHRGYLRLRRPVRPSRLIALDKLRHRLLIDDRFEGTGVHMVEVPLHLDPGVTVSPAGDGAWRLTAGDRHFRLRAVEAAGWTARLEGCEVSPSYGVRRPATRLVFSRTGALSPLSVLITQEGDDTALDLWVAGMRRDGWDDGRAG